MPERIIQIILLVITLFLAAVSEGAAHADTPFEVTCIKRSKNQSRRFLATITIAPTDKGAGLVTIQLKHSKIPLALFKNMSQANARACFSSNPTANYWAEPGLWSGGIWSTPECDGAIMGILTELDGIGPHTRSVFQFDAPTGEHASWSCFIEWENVRPVTP